jgi:hypothetical protein
MNDFSKQLGDGIVQLSGVRWGESTIRDNKLHAREKKLKTAGCAAGGECGLPIPGEDGKNKQGKDIYGPIINWKTCQVVDWLEGATSASKAISDFLPLMRNLVDVYGIKKSAKGFGFLPPRVTAFRFGCIGCPAVGSHKMINRYKNTIMEKALRGIYSIWHEIEKNKNRVFKEKKGRIIKGPIRMEARRQLFARFLDIQKDVGITLVTPEDIEFINECWRDNVYPRGWSQEDENFTRRRD